MPIPEKTKMPKCFNLNNLKNIEKILKGEDVGTLVTG